MDPPRSYDQRRRDSLDLLSADRADAWVATASPAGRAWLVPLSIGWTGEVIVLVTEVRSVTAQNLAASGRARIGLGGTRNVVMIEADVVTSGTIEEQAALVETFAVQSGWDPRQGSEAEAYQVIALRPARLQAWREGNEITGRTLLREGSWLYPPRR